MKGNSLIKLVVSIAVVISAMLITTACNGVEIDPGDGGSITVTPIDPDDNPSKPDNDSIHTHTYSTVESSTNNVSCIQDTTVIYRCSCGDEISEVVEATGHTIRSYEGRAVTCEQDGYEAYEKCIRSGCTYTTYKTIPALEHELATLLDINPTCTTDGECNRVKCMRSGCDYSAGTVVSSLGHITEIIPGTQPTCTESGSTSYEICTRGGCGAKLTEPETIDPLGHDTQRFEGKEPTCTEFGWNAYSVCQRCDYSDYTVILAKGHTLENGYCDCGYRDLKQHNHTWSSGTVVVPATCTANGMMKYTCTDENCGDSKTESVAPLGHSLSYYDAKAATCTEAGHYAYEKCNVCSYTTYVSIAPLDHNFSSGVITTYPTCTLPGVRTYYCRCGMERKVEIEKLGHDFGEWFVSVEPTCTAAGKEQRTCRNGCDYVDTRAVSKLVKATCTSEGTVKRTCNNDPSHEEIRISPKLDHDVSDLTGICRGCGEFVGERLATPSGSVSEATLMWAPVEGADHYVLTVDGEMIKTTATRVDLEQYYGNYNTIQLTVRAMPAEGSEIYGSEMYYYEYTIPGEPLSNVKGIGDAVNLLTGTYTDFAGGTTRIWNENLFRRLRVEDKSTVHGYQVAEVVYSTSIIDYVNRLTESFSNKTSVSASAGLGGVAKVTAGFSFGVGKDYQRTTENKTQTVFYDMDYKYVDKTIELYGYNAKDKLSTMLSDEFLIDAVKVQNREMTAEEFILKYGTHIVTAGTYGAKFNLHYEMLTTTDIASDTFGENIEVGINAQIQGSVGAINLGLGVDNITSIKQEAFTSTTQKNMQTKFIAKAIGGNATGMAVTSLAQFSEVCETWAAGLEESNNYVLIDVPNNSLFFVWDFLGEEYAEAKNILNKYFYTCCDENYYALKDKVSSMYLDSLTYDEVDGTLTVNLSGLQNFNGADLRTLKYEVDDKTYIFNSETGVFTVFSKYYGKDVNKVVFVGSYNTEDDFDRLITNKFNNFCIEFDAGWSRDIVVEFKNFAYEAPAGMNGLDFSKTSSKNITIIVNGESYIKGGDGYLNYLNGNYGIFAPGKNITIEGYADLTVNGGNGTNIPYTYVENAGDGGVGILVNQLNISYFNGVLTINGGKGGDGLPLGNLVSTGSTGSNDVAALGTGGNGGTGGTGIHGGNGGNGADSMDGKLVIECGTAILNGGVGGNGADGSKGGTGGTGGLGAQKGGNGGTGGTGGNGGDAGHGGKNASLIYESNTGATVIINAGADGKVGIGGPGGDGGEGGGHSNLWGSDGSKGSTGKKGDDGVVRS